MVELGSHAATERAAMVTLCLTVSRAWILSRHPHAPFDEAGTGNLTMVEL
jgi:hypothetical protein